MRTIRCNDRKAIEYSGMALWQTEGRSLIRRVRPTCSCLLSMLIETYAVATEGLPPRHGYNCMPVTASVGFQIVQQCSTIVTR